MTMSLEFLSALSRLEERNYQASLLLLPSLQVNTFDRIRMDQRTASKVIDHLSRTFSILSIVLYFLFFIIIFFFIAFERHPWAVY